MLYSLFNIWCKRQLAAGCIEEPQTLSWKVVCFRRTTSNRTTNILVENGSILDAPQTCWLKMARFRRATSSRATKTLLKNGSFYTRHF
jgi:hypothetical protein